MESTRTVNNIKSNLAKSICKTHFELIDYNINTISGDDNSSLHKFLSDKKKMSFTTINTRASIVKIPDYLAYRSNQDYLNLYYLKAKYRSTVLDWDDLLLESYWEYRDYIFTDLFKHMVVSQFKLNINIWSDNDYFKKSRSDLKRVIDYYILLLDNSKGDRELYVKNIILFYFVIKNPVVDLKKNYSYITNDRVSRIYLSSTLNPKMIPLGDDSVNDLKYLSKELEKTYSSTISKALTSIFE